MPSTAATRVVWIGGRLVTPEELLAWSRSLDKEKLTLNDFLDKHRN